MSSRQCKKGCNILFGVVRGIREEAGVYPADNAIATLVQEAVNVGVHEVVVQKREPDLLHEFVLEEGEYGRGWRDLICIMVCLEDGTGELVEGQSALCKARR